MAKQTINLGAVANDGTGDTLRDAGTKINANFTEVYADIAALEAGGGGGGGTAQTYLVGTFAEADAGSYATGIDRIRTSGFAADGDGGAAEYDRVTGTLAAGGEGVWWFTAADSSKWQIASAPEHMAAQFGALGGSGINAQPILQAALDAPMVKQLNLGALNHYLTKAAGASGDAILLVPSGKWLVGINRQLSWLYIVPLPSGQTQSGPRTAVLHKNDQFGGSRDYSLNCQRSGEGRGDQQRTHGVAIYAQGNGNKCIGTRVERVDVYNCWGYAQYDVAQAGTTAECVNVMREDCRAFNFQVGFEATGKVTVTTRDTWADANPTDGGTTLACSDMYHEYGAVQRVERFNPTGRGPCSACISIVNTDNVDIERIRYVNPDMQVTSDNPCYVVGSGANTIKYFELDGGQIINTGYGAVFEDGNFVIKGTKIKASIGAGLTVGGGATADIYNADIEGTGNGSTFAYGVVDNGATKIRWHGGGRIAGIDGGVGAAPYNGTAIEFYGSPRLIPATATSEIVSQLYSFARASWSNQDATHNYVVIDVTDVWPTGIGDITRAQVTPVLRLPIPESVVAIPDYFLAVLWLSSTQARVYIKSSNALTGSILNVTVTEYPALV